MAELTLGGYTPTTQNQTNIKPTSSLPGEEGSAERAQYLTQQWEDARTNWLYNNTGGATPSVSDQQQGAQDYANTIGMTDQQYQDGLATNYLNPDATNGVNTQQNGGDSSLSNIGTNPDGTVNNTTTYGLAQGDTSVRDGGSNLERGAYSTGKEIPVNSTNPDGNVQGEFKDTRGNEYRAQSLDDMNIERATAATADANQRQLTEAELASMRANDIMAQDSPLMALARSKGIDFANARGLQNSSLAAGAAMREMAGAATPLAMQEASHAYGMEGQNQVLESDRLQQNAAREQQVNLSNQAAENAATSQEHSTEAGIRQQNAAMANDMLNSDRQRTMSYALQQLAGDQDFAKQTLASQSAVDIANIEGQFKQLISENDTAARMYDATYNSIADILSNKDIHADEASEKVNYLVGMMENMMNSLLAFDQIDLSASGSSGTGKNSDFSSGTTQDSTQAPNQPDVQDWQAYL